MPSWKKVIISGSDAALSSLHVTGPVTASVFVGDGSQLTGISGGSITIADDGSTQGSAIYLNFGSNLSATVSANTASISATGGSSFPYTGSAKITGSVDLTGSLDVSSSLANTRAAKFKSSGSNVILVEGATKTLLEVNDSIGSDGLLITGQGSNIIKVSGSTGTILTITDSSTSQAPIQFFGVSGADSISYFQHTTNSFAQVNVQNLSSGISASSDFVATNNIGTQGTYYTNMGINSSGFGDFVGGPNDGYLYHTGSHFYIGNLTSGKNLYLFTSTTSSAELIISGTTGYIGINKATPLFPLDVVGNTVISGSLVSTDNRFSKGGTLADYTTGIADNRSYYVWRAPFRCRVVAVYGIREGGSSTPVNASRHGPSGYGLHLASNLSVSGTAVWQDGGSVQNTDYVAGDQLQIRISGSGASPNQIGVQVDFIRL